MQQDKTFNREFGQRLKGLLQMKNSPQTALARQLGVNPTTVHEWIVGNKFPNSKRLPMIADFFGVSTSELMGTVVTQASSNDNGNLPCGSLETLFADKPEVLKYLRASSKELIIDGKPSDLSCISETSKMLLRGAILNALKEAGVEGTE